jgi:CRP-like cAMP-binding protein
MDNESDHSHLGVLESLEYLGSATDMLDKIEELMGHAPFFEDLTHEDVGILCTYLKTYRARPGQEIIREGDHDDFMLLVVSGSVNIVKVDSHGDVRPMTIVRAGATLGEMSMIDGEPRFASCVAIDTTVFAILNRDDMVKIILDNTTIGAKVLIKLVTMLSQRLRVTSNQLIDYMERTEAV